MPSGLASGRNTADYKLAGPIEPVRQRFRFIRRHAALQLIQLCVINDGDDIAAGSHFYQRPLAVQCAGRTKPSA